MTPTKTPNHRVVNYAAAMVFAIITVMLLALSRTTVDAATHSPAHGSKRIVTAATALPPSRSTTAASMNYHDNIDVAAISVAAYDR
jgi:hypothetical protein